MAPSGIRQPLEQEDRKEDESQTGKEINRPVIQDQLQALNPTIVDLNNGKLYTI